MMFTQPRLMNAMQAVGSTPWSSGLVSCHDAPSYPAACLCPCLAIHELADVLDSRERNAPEVAACYSSIISCVLDLPVFFCMDQFTTRGMDYLADRPTARQAHAAAQADYEEEQARNAELEHEHANRYNPLSWIKRNTFDYLLVNHHPDEYPRYGQDHAPPSWEADGVGWCVRLASIVCYALFVIILLL